MKNVGKKAMALVMMLVLLVGSMVSLPALAEKKSVKGTEIKITGSGYVAKGKSITLKAEVLPAGSSQKVKWESSNKKIATVSSTGKVQGKKAGKVKITVTSKDNKKLKATWKIEVMEKPVKSIKISAKTTKLDLNGTSAVTLKAKASPSSAAQAFEWKSSNRKIAKVSSEGKVTAVSVGEATITATAKDGSKKKASIKIKVLDSTPANPGNNNPGPETPQVPETPEVPNVPDNGNPDPAANLSEELKISENRWILYTPAAGSKTITITSERNWTASSDAAWLTVSRSGQNLTLNAAKNNDGKERLASVTVSNGAQSAEMKVVQSNIAVGPTILTQQFQGTSEKNPAVITAQKYRLDLTKTRSDDPYFYVQTYKLSGGSWKKIGTSLREGTTYTMNPSDKYNGYAAGNTYKFVLWEHSWTEWQYADQTGIKWNILPAERCTVYYVKVTEASVPVTGITLNKKVTLTVGGTKTLTATVLPENATNKTLTWKSSKTSVVTVDNAGKLTAKSTGSATVTASDASGKVSASCTVTVNLKAPKLTEAYYDEARDKIVGKWQKVDEADYYEFCVFQNPDLEPVGDYGSQTTDNEDVLSLVFARPEKGTTYYVAVKACMSCNTFVSDYSNVIAVNIPVADNTFMIKHGNDTVLAQGATSGTVACDSKAGKGDKLTLTVTSGADWTVSASDTSWVSVTKSGSKAVVTVGNVEPGNKYTSKLTFKANNKSYKVTVTLDKIPVFTASFATSSKTLTLGEKWIVDAEVSVKGGSQYLGIVTINSADLSGSTLTDNFKDHKYTKVNTRDWAAYTIDTTKSPWNQPGTYTIRIWAKDTCGIGGDKQLATMTVTILPGTLPSSIFMAQPSGSTTCTLYSCMMMIRARAYLSGSDTWRNVTESTAKSSLWINGEGMRINPTYKFSGNTITLNAKSTGGSISSSSLKSLLDNHPEGIVLYWYNNPMHAVLITRYSGSTFYCADPNPSYAGKEITLANSSICKPFGRSQSTALSQADQYWYVQSYNIVY